MMDALANAIEAGWEAPRIVVDEDGGPGLLDEPPGDGSPDGTVLDYRVLGYPGGAIILVVLDGGSLMQTSVAITGLAQHLTTWSPGLLEYAPDEVKISRADEPYDGENWLPRLDSDDEEEDTEEPRWHLAELLDDDFQELASEYLLARGIRSLWHPADPVEGHRARDVVLGAVESPWGRELASALGVLLVRAARFENRSGSSAGLVVQGSGEPELAADLLRRAREAGRETEAGGPDDDKMRGHVLVEQFAEEHQLPWNQVLGDESPEESEERGNRQLKALLWAACGLWRRWRCRCRVSAAPGSCSASSAGTPSSPSSRGKSRKGTTRKPRKTWRKLSPRRPRTSWSGWRSGIRHCSAARPPASWSTGSPRMPPRSTTSFTRPC